MPLGETLKQLAKILPLRRKPGSKPRAPHLSVRQVQVVDCIAAGMSDPDIADALQLKVGTVRVYISVIYHKLFNLPSNSRVAVAVRAARSRYVCPHCGAPGPDLWLTLRGSDADVARETTPAYAVGQVSGVLDSHPAGRIPFMDSD